MNLRNETADSRVTETGQNRQLQEFTLSISLNVKPKSALLYEESSRVIRHVHNDIRSLMF